MAATSEKSYPLIEVLATAIAVDDAQGFVSNTAQDLISFDTGNKVVSNKSKVKAVLEGTDTSVILTDDHMNRAVALKEFFDSITVEKKLSGANNGFDTVIGKLLDSDTVAEFGLSVCASLPNGMRIQHMRDRNEQRLSALATTSEYIGKEGVRMRMNIEILDIKYVKKLNKYILTGTVADTHIIRATWAGSTRHSALTAPDISQLVAGHSWEIDATIAYHGTTDDTKETILSHIKFNRKIG